MAVQKKSIQDNYIAAFREVVGKLSLAQRRQLAPQIQLLQGLLGATEDLIVDRRCWPYRAPRRPNQVPKPPCLSLAYRDCEGLADAQPVTYEEAAQLLGRSVHALRIMVSKGGGVANLKTRDDELVVLRRLTPV